ncbi:DUF4287 domain-containing protein, partial [Frankia sp. CNm7]|uniref:DUF4287 domain-containing protein n=1 Tax=Frankia nepalensis TaxID=1836974 RepID=UPI0019323BBD
MTFEGYLRTIKDRTGLGPDDFVRLAADRGLTGPAVKAGDVIRWLAADYGLGRGHAMAIVAVLKGTAPAGVVTPARPAGAPPPRPPPAGGP